MIKVGIPRALLYYEYYPTWQTFFEELGAEIVVSPPTTQAMLAEGCSRVVADTCLPVKVFCGHVLTLVDKCDCIFVPAIRSVKSKVYNCSKLLGLLSIIKHLSNNAPWTKIISAFRFGLAKLNALDEIERVVQKVRAVELIKGTANKLFAKAIAAIDKANDYNTLKKVRVDYADQLSLFLNPLGVKEYSWKPI